MTVGMPVGALLGINGFSEKFIVCPQILGIPENNHVVFSPCEKRRDLMYVHLMAHIINVLVKIHPVLRTHPRCELYELNDELAVGVNQRVISIPFDYVALEWSCPQFFREMSKRQLLLLIFQQYIITSNNSVRLLTEDGYYCLQSITVIMDIV